MSRRSLVLVASAAFVVVGCPKKEDPKPTPSPTTTMAPAPKPSASTTATEAPKGPPGTIAGIVKFTGTVPEMKEVTPPPTDPACHKPKIPRENSVLVKDGGLKDVFVRIANGAIKSDVKPPAPKIDQIGCVFLPRVVGAMPGQEVTFLNGDKTMHNVQVWKGMETIFNTGQPEGNPGVKKQLPDEAGILKVKCNVHPFMSAFILITDHPFFTATADDGKFELKNVPAGKYVVEAWHSEYGLKTATVVVEGGKTIDPTFSYDGNEKPVE